MTTHARITVPPEQLGNIFARGKLIGMTRIHLRHQGDDYAGDCELNFIERLRRDEVPLDGSASQEDIALVQEVTESCHAAWPRYVSAESWDRACARFAGSHDRG